MLTKMFVRYRLKIVLERSDHSWIQTYNCSMWVFNQAFNTEQGSMLSIRKVSIKSEKRVMYGSQPVGAVFPTHYWPLEYFQPEEMLLESKMETKQHIHNRKHIELKLYDPF